MINLWYFSEGVFVYNADDWTVLRKNHRIIGETTGNSNNIPKLPLKLQPTEVLLLMEKKLVKVLKKKNDEDINAAKSNIREFEDNLLEEQKLLYKRARKIQLENFKDNIIAAKRKKNDFRTEEEIINEELEKSCQVTKDNMIWPIFTETLNLQTDNCEEIAESEILKSTTKIKYGIYKDLWEKGYYVTPGHKFGGDFLVYKGDPIIFHAIFIVRCVENSEQIINSSEIVAFGRLGTSVKKRAVLASLLQDKPSYLTINWIDA